MKLFIRIIQLLIITAFIFGWGKAFALSEAEISTILEESMDKTTEDDPYFFLGTKCYLLSGTTNACLKKSTCYDIDDPIAIESTGFKKVGIKCICKGFFQKVDGGHIVLTEKIIESAWWEEWEEKASYVEELARSGCLTNIQLAAGKLKMGLLRNYTKKQEGELINIRMECSYPTYCKHSTNY